MSRMKFKRPSSAWLVLVWVSPRPVKPSIAKGAMPSAVHAPAHLSPLGPLPPEPCISTTTGSRPVPAGSLSWPDTVAGLASESPARNCLSDNVSVWMACSSVRAAMSRTGSAPATGIARPSANAAMAQLLIMTFLPGAFSGIIAQTIVPMEIEMPRHKTYVPHGVIPAVILPFHDDLSIDEPSFRKHLRDVTAADGLSAVTINAHSTEVASCTFDEQKRVLDIAGSEIGDTTPLINGIWADGSLEAARLAKMATAGGASALLVFPPAPFTMGQNVAMAVEHFKRIADASDLPLIAFQYPLATGQGYPNETILRMIEDIPSLKAIKDWAGTPQQHEWHVRTLQNLSRPFTVLSTQSSWLMASLTFGCKGLLSGSGSVIADLQAQLFRAVQAGDLKAAQAINDRIYPLASVFYAQPWVDMHNRMKEALVLMGKLPRAVVRPPLVKIERAEVERIRKALVGAKLLPAASAKAA